MSGKFTSFASMTLTSPSSKQGHRAVSAAQMRKGDPPKRYHERSELVCVRDKLVTHLIHAP